MDNSQPSLLLDHSTISCAASRDTYSIFRFFIMIPFNLQLCDSKAPC